jgi:hypothetical protein
LLTIEPLLHERRFFFPIVFSHGNLNNRRNEDVRHFFQGAVRTSLRDPAHLFHFGLILSSGQVLHHRDLIVSHPDTLTSVPGFENQIFAVLHELDDATLCLFFFRQYHKKGKMT